MAAVARQTSWKRLPGRNVIRQVDVVPCDDDAGLVVGSRRRSLHCSSRPCGEQAAVLADGILVPDATLAEV
eukprot:847106-Heterocapsa_arctica.AAC.1